MAENAPRPRRAGRPRAALKGNDRAVHEFVNHLVGMVEVTGTSLAAVASACECSRSTVSKRLNGEALPEWSFVDKVVRTCTPVEKQEARLGDMRRRWERANREAGRALVAEVPEPSGTRLYTRLVEAQAQTIHVQRQFVGMHDELTRVNEQLVESVRAEARTSQMVYVLHLVIHQLNDLVVRLTAQRDQYLKDATHHRDEVEQINMQVSTALSDCDRAERQLHQARTEKNRAAALAEAAQRRIDQLELELRNAQASAGVVTGDPGSAVGSEPAHLSPDAGEVLLDTHQGLDRMQRLLDDQGDQLDRLDLLSTPSLPSGAEDAVPPRLLYQPAGEPAVTHQVVRVLVLATEWTSGRGGISMVNRLLCTALSAAGAEVFCRVPAATLEELSQAAAVGVELLVAPAVPAGSSYEGLARAFGLPVQAPDLIIGYGLITGQYARLLAQDVFPGVRWYLVTHTIPDQSEWYRTERPATQDAAAEDHTRREWDLGRTATRVVTVGPQLYRRAQRYLAAFPGAPEPIRLDPGFDVVGPPRRPPPGPLQILIDGVQGLDIAARAMRPALERSQLRVSDIELLARGGSAAQAAELMVEIQRITGIPGLSVVVRPYTSDTTRLRDDLLHASLVLMPSRSEAFGLVELEAIVAGTPVLVSDRSGLAELLGELVPDEAHRMVVTVTGDDDQDTLTWGRAIATAIQDREAAFANVEVARMTLAARRTWAMAAEVILSSLSVAADR